VALVWALRIIVQRMEDDPGKTPSPKKRLSKVERAKTAAKPATPSEPHPKPQRVRGHKRRF